MMINEKAIKPDYGLNEWEIVEDAFSIAKNYHNETVFAIGNGFIGTRGTFEEGLKECDGSGFEGTFLNGIYESETIKYGEIGYGYPEKSQTMVNVANGKVVKLQLEDECFDMQEGRLIEYKRSINMKEGILKRSVVWQSPKGKEIKLEIERLVCFQRKNLAAIHYHITPLNFDGNIRIFSEIDGNAKHSAAENDPRIGSGLAGEVLYTIEAKASEDMAVLIQSTKNTGTVIASAIGNILEECVFEVNAYIEHNKAGIEYLIAGKREETIQYTKYIAYTAYPQLMDGILEQALEGLKEVKKVDYRLLKKEQSDFLENFWSRSDIEIKGDVGLQQAIRFNLFHLIQSVGRDGMTNISAKGLTGEGYEGHYFWDTEMYIVPAFLYSHPDISRKLLEYRYNTLDKARERARQMAHKTGVLFPWRTINGEECSSYYPASTAQYHINADIAYAVKKYIEATQDIDFLLQYGAEIVFETARVWMNLGFFNPEKEGRFCINCVTGPDEYTAIVNNNCFTNLMAQENLRYAYGVAEAMKAAHPAAYAQLADKIGLEADELLEWKNAADRMYIPYNEKHGIHPQDDSFFDKAVWDFKGTPAENYPLLLHYHPLVIYRHQVCKQADLVLAMFLLKEKFDLEQKKRNFSYYEKVTTHDSSLSTCIFSIVASHIGDYEKAYNYFIKTAKMDLEDYQGNTNHGVHTANMAGSWMCIVNGFVGMSVEKDQLHFMPYLPSTWEQYSIQLVYRGNRIKVTVNREQTLYELLEGDALTIVHKNQTVELTAGKIINLN